MSNQSITNKLIANINQASDVSKNMLRGSNVICIDTSNRRIGIDTKNPKWSIDISGDGSYNGIKCHNLDICGTAEISNGIIYDLRSITISGDLLDISNGYFKKIDVSVIDVSTINSIDISVNNICGEFIYLNQSICGNFFKYSSGIISEDLSINGTLRTNDFRFPPIADFSIVNIENSLNLIPGSNVDFSGTVNFLNSETPVNFIDLSGIHILTSTISCNILSVSGQADFSSISVSSEASFNSIIVSGEASFNTISAETIAIKGISLESFVRNQNSQQLSDYSQTLDISSLKAKKICVHNDISNVFDNSYNESFIDKLLIFESLDFSRNFGELIYPSFSLPIYTPTTNVKKGNTFLSLNNNGVVESLKIIKQMDINDQPVFLTLKETSIRSLMVENSGNDFINIDDDKSYECIKIKQNDKNNNSAEIFDNQFSIRNIDTSYIIIPSFITQNTIEINANLTIKLNNDNQGNDVDALNYNFYILGKTKNTNSVEILAQNKNSVIVFDNSYNYNSTSLNFLGNHRNRIRGETSPGNYILEDLSYIFFGISYENPKFKQQSGEILTISLESFTASIKTIN